MSISTLVSLVCASSISESTYVIGCRRLRVAVAVADIFFATLAATFAFERVCVVVDANFESHVLERWLGINLVERVFGNLEDSTAVIDPSLFSVIESSSE